MSTTRTIGPTMRVPTDLYLGMMLPVERVDNQTNTSDWVGVYLGGSRLSWEWLKNGKCTIKPIGFEGATPKCPEFGLTPPMTLTLQLWQGGGWFSSGTKVADRTLVLKNPLTHASVKVLPAEGAIEVTYQFGSPAAVPAKAHFTIVFDGVRVVARPVKNVSGVVLLPMPRCGGQFTVNCLFDSDGGAVLFKSTPQLIPSKNRTLDVIPGAVNLASLRAAAVGGRPSVAVGAPANVMLASPNQPFTAWCNGMDIQSQDLVVVVRVGDGNPDGAPPTSALQLASKQTEMKATVEQPTLSLLSPGMYFVCLAVKHECCYLLGATALVLVSGRRMVLPPTPSSGAAAAPPPPQPLSVPQYPPSVTSVPTKGTAAPAPARPYTPPPAPQATVVSPSTTAAQGAVDSSYVCCICCDRTVMMLIRPCNHLCMCQGCCAQLQSQRGNCPICRQSIQSAEKVFFA